MNEQHLGLAFSRRMARTLQDFGYSSQYTKLESVRNPECSHHFRISSELGTIWIVTHHMMNASNRCKKHLLDDIHEWQAEYGFSLQPNDLLVLISDHWIGRSRQSRELLHWWMGELPDSLDLYSKQGVTLFQSESQLTQELEQNFKITPCFMKYTHPLKKKTVEDQLVRKYIQLYATLEWQ